MASTIILSDNGASSGSAGLKQTAGNDGVLILQTTTSGGTATNALSISNTQAITVVNTGTGVTFSSSAGSGLRVYGASGTNQWDMYLNSTNLRFSDNTGGGRIVIDGTASVGTTFGVGGATPSASGAGITFPATQSASSDVNTLDDYEEGTWTPTITNSGSAISGISYTTQVGYYTKIGRNVTIWFRIVLANKGIGSYNISLSSLPFTTANVDIYPSMYGYHHNINSGSGNTTNGVTPTLQVSKNTTNADFYGQVNNSPTPITDAYLQNGSTLNGSITYFIS